MQCVSKTCPKWRVQSVSKKCLKSLQCLKRTCLKQQDKIRYTAEGPLSEENVYKSESTAKEQIEDEPWLMARWSMMTMVGGEEPVVVKDYAL